jgi:hypothetical protein
VAPPAPPQPRMHARENTVHAGLAPPPTPTMHKHPPGRPPVPGPPPSTPERVVGEVAPDAAHRPRREAERAHAGRHAAQGPRRRHGVAHAGAQVRRAGLPGVAHGVPGVHPEQHIQLPRAPGRRGPGVGCGKGGGRVGRVGACQGDALTREGSVYALCFVRERSSVCLCLRVWVRVCAIVRVGACAIVHVGACVRVCACACENVCVW